MPAPWIQSVGAIAAGTGAVTPPLPAGLAVNDILLLELASLSNVGTITIPTPNGGTWTEITPSHASSHRGTWFWSRYNGTQGAPTTSVPSAGIVARIASIRGAITTGSPINASDGSAPGAAATSSSLPTITTTVNNCLIIFGITGNGPDGDGVGVYSACTNSNLTSIAEYMNNSSLVSTGLSLGMALGIKAALGAVGITTVTHPSIKTAYKQIAITPQDAGDPPPDVGVGMGKNDRGQVTIDGVPTFMRMLYDAGFAGANSTDLLGHFVAVSYT